MSERFNDLTFHCVDQDALIGYVYDECEPHEREAIAAHLATCASCADDVAGLGAARRMLPAWTPPTPALGFQITAANGSPVAGADPSGRMAEAPRWWQRPLPAWAQAAAAVAIFAAGLFAGTAREAAPRTTDAQQAIPPGASGRPTPAGAERVEERPALPARSPDVSREDLARIESELRAELVRVERARLQTGPRLQRAADSAETQEGSAVTIERVRALIQESELRQRQALREGMAEVVADFDTKRFRQLGPMLRTVEDLREETQTHRRELSILGNAVVGSNQLVLRTSGSGR